jgi:hypothetical protein
MKCVTSDKRRGGGSLRKQVVCLWVSEIHTDDFGNYDEHQCVAMQGPRVGKKCVECGQVYYTNKGFEQHVDTTSHQDNSYIEEERQAKLASDLEKARSIVLLEDKAKLVKAARAEHVLYMAE